MIRGTTPIIVYKFNKNQVGDFTGAFLTLIQGGTKIEKDITTATVDTEGNTIGWALTQDDTLKLDEKKDALIQIRYKVGDVAGASSVQKIPVGRILKEGVI